MPYASSSMRVIPYRKSVRLRNRGRHEAGSCRRLSSDAQIPKAANVAFRQSQAFRRRGCRTARLLRFPGHPPGAAVSSRPRRTSTFRSFARISSGLALLAMSQGHNRSRDSLEYRATFLGRQTTFPLVSLLVQLLGRQNPRRIDRTAAGSASGSFPVRAAST